MNNILLFNSEATYFNASEKEAVALQNTVRKNNLSFLFNWKH